MSSASVSSEKPAPPSMIGRVLDGRFRIDALLGEGGLGQVYRGTHLRLSKPVAIKVMHAHHVTKDELRTRFDREAKSLAALSHPNVVGVIDYGLDGEVPFLVMDLLEGRTLEAAIHDGLPTERVVPIFRDVLRAVAYAHGIGLVHRDLKPANVFLQQVPEIGEVVRVLDFGLAKFVDGEGAHATVTRAGMVIGTPAYMSPEQATASIVDARADVYSLGVMLFEMVTGRRPFTGDDGAEVLRKHLLQPLPKMSDVIKGSSLVPLLEPLVLRATEKTKSDRYTDASEMAVALDGIVGRGSTPMPAPKKMLPRDTKAESIHITISDIPISGAKSGAKSAAKSNAKSAAKAPSSPPPSMGRLAIGAGVVVIVVVALVIALGSGTTKPETTTVDAPPPTTRVALPTTIVAPPPTSAIAAPPPPPTSVVAAPPPTTTAPPPSTTAPVDAPDPWAAPIPPQLGGVVTRLDSNRELSRDQRALLVRFNSNHPHDPRGWLMLGRGESIAHAYTDACHHYQRAFDIDPNARFDPHMRRDLVTIASSATGTLASRMVRTIYGTEALEMIATVAQELARDRAATGRLDRLREQITNP